MDGGNSRKPVETDLEAASVVSWASRAAKENGLHGVASELDFAHAYLTRAQLAPADVVAKAIEAAIDAVWDDEPSYPRVVEAATEAARQALSGGGS